MKPSGLGMRVMLIVAAMAALTLHDVSVLAQSNAEDRGPAGEPYSPSSAFKWSLVGTLAPLAAGAGLAATGPTDGVAWALPIILFAGGGIVGPSLGHFYAKQNRYAVATTAARAIAGVGFATLAVAACPEFEDCSSSEETRLATFLALGVGLVGVSAVFDIIRAPASARRTNRRNAQLSIAPRLPIDQSVGVSMRVTF